MLVQTFEAITDDNGNIRLAETVRLPPHRKVYVVVPDHRQIVRDVLTPLAQIRFSNPAVVNEAVYDTERDRYLIVTTGWESKDRRIYFTLVHLDIMDGKVWIQYDGTEDGIGYELEAAGVSKSDIVPAFHPEDVRPYTGYAVA